VGKISPEWVTDLEQGKSSGRIATFSLWTSMFRANLLRAFWIHETGTGQQVAQLHDRYMMMMMMMIIIIIRRRDTNVDNYNVITLHES
jgi:hypothetical protein